jgi:EF-P beta-lysylation protein EpmB
MKTWQDEMREAFRDPRDLAGFLGIALGDLPALPEGKPFPMLVPRAFAARMERGNPRDPLLLQVWPDARESAASPGETTDPVGDGAARKADGLLHKYRGRVLLVTTGACAVHCRYCFRQNFPYGEVPHAPSRWDAALESIAGDGSIREVLLSGGDPLTLPDGALAGLLERLEAIPHLETLRIHTRLPVVLPSRIEDGFCQRLARSRLRTAVVLHANHAQEIDGEVEAACARLRRAGAVLLNQSVLLRGVNDSVEALDALSRRLWLAGAIPYYLHALDRVTGSSRFAVEDAEGTLLVEALRLRLPGYLVPRLVREIEGEGSKTPL